MKNKIPGFILETIFAYVERDSSTFASRNRQLVALSRVCKEWSNPALNLLWRRCNDLSVLLETLPAELLAINDDDGSVSFTRGLRPEDLLPLVAQSQRIQELRYFHHSPNTLHRLSPGLVAQLVSCRDDIFPNLQRLHLTAATPKGWTLLNHFASSTLTHLVLDFRFSVTTQTEAYRTALDVVLSQVQNSLTSVRTFVVKSHEGHEEFLLDFTKLASHLPALRKIQCPLGGPTFPASFQQLCSLGTLLFADLRVLVGTFELDQLSIVHESFRNLKTLYLDATTSFYIPLMQTLRSTSLNNIRLILREHSPCPTETFQSLIQSTCSATSNLQVFNLKVLSPKSRRSVSNFPSAAVLLPLLGHNMLEELVIDLGVPLNLSDADIDAIARMWPNMRKLRLTTDVSPYTADGWKPRVTCRAVMTLLYHLPHLNELAFEFDGSTLNDVGKGARSTQEVVRPSTSGDKHSTNNPSVITSKLKSLDVGGSVAGIPLNVACWVFVMCPKLRQLHCPSDNEAWRTTNALLELVQTRSAAKIRDAKSSQ